MKANFRLLCHPNRFCSVLPEHSDWHGMKDDQQRFLSLLGQLPVRLTGEQAAWVLNCQSHDIPALIHARLLKPLGNPSANSTKYFATGDLLEIARDRAWLVKMTTAINTHWQKQNARQKFRSQTDDTAETEMELVRR